MGNCPLCDGPTSMPSKRLIKDACGHIKCRLCLLQEETGCSLCTFTDIQDKKIKMGSICNIDRIEKLQFVKNLIESNSVILDTLIKSIDTLSFTDFWGKKFTAYQLENILENKIQSQIIKADKQINIKFINDVEYFGCLTINKSFKALENNRVYIKRIEKDDYNEHNVTNDIVINRSIDYVYNSDNTVIEQSIVTCNGQNENQEHQSSPFRLSDYLLFDKQYDQTYNEPVLSPIHSLDYKYTEFRLPDYLWLNEKPVNDKYVIIITEDQFEKKISDQSNDLSNAIIAKKRSSESVYPNNVTMEKNFIIEKVVIQNHPEEIKSFKSSKIIFDNNTENCFDKEGAMLEKIFDLNENDANKKQEKPIQEIVCIQSCNADHELFNNKNCNFPSKKIVSTCEDPSYIENEKLVEYKDENKENKQVSFDKIKCESPIKNSEVVTLRDKKKFNSKVHHNHLERLDEYQEYTNEINDIRRGKRKRKPKMLIYEDEELKVVKKDTTKHRRYNTDWGHIITLSGDPTKYKCTICQKIFKSIHCKCYHSSCLKIGKPPFQCTICKRTFSKRSHFEYHERMHSGDKPFQCEICDKRFIQKNKLNRHLFIHKQYNDIECDECGKKFRTKDSLKSHLAIHLKNSYKCGFCSKTFKLEPNKKRHERSHTSERIHKCDTCPKSFKDKFLLTRHKRSHDKSRPYSCLNCSKVFLSKFELQRHTAVHSDIKPYSCELCNLRFRRKDNLHRHIRHHHSEDAFDQSLCTNNAENAESEEKMIVNILTANVPEVVEEIVHSKNLKKIRRVSKQNKKDDSDQSMPNLTKNLRRKKKISRRTSTSSMKNSYKLWLQDTSQPSNKNEPMVNDAGSLSRSAVDSTSKRSENKKSKLSFTISIPHEEALNLNRQIEEKIYSQSAFCKFPGCTQNMTLVESREPQKSILVVRDEPDLKNKVSQLKSKTTRSNEDETINGKKIDESTFSTKNVYVHWRRRAAESLKPKISK